MEFIKDEDEDACDAIGRFWLVRFEIDNGDSVVAFGACKLRVLVPRVGGVEENNLKKSFCTNGVEW